MKFLYLISVIFISLILLSCSNSSNPILNTGMPDISTSNDLIPISELSNPIDGTNLNSRGVLGTWQIRVDIENLTAEILPSRNAAAIGNIFDSDLSQFLTVSPCANCLIIPKVWLNGYDDLLMTVKIKHPFENINSRPDLHGFDVRAIFIAMPMYEETYPDIKVTRPTGIEEDATFGDMNVNITNADGFTSHYDELVTDSRYFLGGSDIPGNLNPFLRFFEDNSMPPFNPLVPDGQNVMAVGSSYYSRNVVFDKLMINHNELVFYLVADVAYGQSAVFSNRDNPQYYLPAFHRTEPWRIEYWFENNNLSPLDPLSTADMVVQVFDWQHGYAVDPNYPDPANLGGLPESSDVLQLELSIPDFQDDVIIATTPESGTGAPDDPLQYRLTVTNTNQSGWSRNGLLAIRDQLNGSAAPSGRMPIPPQPAGFPYETLDIRDYSLYMPVIVNIENPFIMGSPYWREKNEVLVLYEELYARGRRAIMYPDFFMDPSHKKFQYKWDYDYDGVTFNEDGSGLPPDPIIFPTGGRYDVGLRVRTNSKPPREYTYSMPIYSQGIGFHNNNPSTPPTSESTSRTNNNALAMSRGVFYMTFLHEEGGQRDVYVSIGDRQGSFNTINVTNNANVEFDPSLTIINGGYVYDGIYIVFGDGTNGYLYFTKGDLDGTNFTTPIRITTANPDGEYIPYIFVRSGRLHVYYLHWVFIFGNVYGAHSDDWGDTWIEDGWLVNNASPSQGGFSVVSGGGYTYIIWDDQLNSVERWTDLYMAKSSDGINFTDIELLPLSVGKVGEFDPSCTFYSDQLMIAYTRTDDITSIARTNIAFKNIITNSLQIYPIYKLSGLNQSDPAISCYGEGRFVVAFSTFNAGSLSQVILEINQLEGVGSLSETIIYNQNVGLVPDIYTTTHPGIVSGADNPFCAEYFITWTKYNDGIFESPLFPGRDFGKVERMYYVGDRYHPGWL